MAEQQHTGAQPNCRASAQSPAQPRRGLPEIPLGSLLFLSLQENAGDRAPKPQCPHEQVWAGSSRAGGDKWEGKGEISPGGAKLMEKLEVC